jgi:hypothetical protein
MMIILNIQKEYYNVYTEGEYQEGWPEASEYIQVSSQ